MTVPPIVVPPRLHSLLSMIVWVTAFLVVVIGCVAILFSVIGLLDPVGAKAADDNDPIGPPATLAQNITTLTIWLLFTLFGGALPIIYYRLIKKI